jgi:hypothetical protein
MGKMASKDDYRPFSQRTGLVPVPPQLQLGQVSEELRRLIDYAVDLEIEREKKHGTASSYFSGSWLGVSKDLHVRFFGEPILTYKNEPHRLRVALERCFANFSLGKLFDLVEFFVRHPNCSNTLKAELVEAFATARAAYRIIDSQVVAIGTAEQGAAVVAAIDTAEAIGASAARSHLIAAGAELRNGNWPGSVRESIHAVESMARILAPGTDALGPALTILDKADHLHGSLRTAFLQLYGYTCNEEGVRHAKVFGDEAQVDEADALFMLGACASFVSYLISRTSKT